MNAIRQQTRHLIYVDETEACVGDDYCRAYDDAVQSAVADLIANHEEEFYAIVNEHEAKCMGVIRAADAEAARENYRESLQDR